MSNCKSPTPIPYPPKGYIELPFKVQTKNIILRFKIVKVKCSTNTSKEKIQNDEVSYLLQTS